MGKPRFPHPLLDDYEKLYNAYVVCNKSTTEIAREIGCSPGLISKRLKEHGISARSTADNKSQQLPLPLGMEEALYRLYVTERMSISAIARALERPKATIRGWLEKAEIVRRTTSEAMLLQSEELSNRAKKQWTADRRQHASGVRKKQWQNQADRSKILNSLGKVMKTEGYRRKMSEASKRLHSDERYKKKLRKIFNDPEYRRRQSENSKKMWEDPAFCARMASVRAQMPRISSLQLTLYDLLGELGINYEREYVLGPYTFDCYISDHNLLIEVQGEYWHSLRNAVSRDKAKASYVERHFPQLRLKYLWEHEFKCPHRVMESLRYWMNMSKLKHYEIREVKMEHIDASSSRQFLSRYHYLTRPGNATMRYGFFLKDILIGVVTYGPITRKESAERLGYKSHEMLELTRMAIHPVYQRKNLASFMISKTVRDLRHNGQIHCLLAFADETFNHEGIIYKAAGWKLDGVVVPTYWYCSSDGWVMHKKTLYNHAQAMKMTERQYAEKMQYRKVWGLSKKRFILPLVGEKQ